MGEPETILLYVALLLFAAKIGGEAATRIKQPAVVGEILVGILLGPTLLNVIPPFSALDAAKASAGVSTVAFSDLLDLNVLGLLALLGVLILLFEVGLESNVRELRKVGLSATLVGTYGVLFSLAVGAAGSWLIAREFDWVVTGTAQGAPNLLHVFIGATLTATSVGITARVLKDMSRLRTEEGQIILGAAVWDDVLGLIILAIISGLVANPESLTAASVAGTLALAVGFFAAAIVLGGILAPRLIELVHLTFRDPHIHLAFAMIFMLALAYLATWVGLAAIVGAFAAGLAISGSKHRHVIFEHIKPVGSLLVGFFFVVLGLRVDLSDVTADRLPLILIVALGLTIAGIIAKLAAGWGVVRSRASKYVVGVGMVPRGEVGLIFALFGLEHGLLENWQYSTLILVVLLTTLVTPFWLKAVAGRFSPERTPQLPPQAPLESALP